MALPAQSTGGMLSSRPVVNDSRCRTMLAPARREHARKRLGQRVREVARIVQAAAFMARHGAFHDQVRHFDQVAQLEQVGRDAEVAVVLVDLFLEQLDPVQRAFKALGRAHDADVIPHEAAQLVPVVGDHHFLIGVRHAAGVPVRQRRIGNRRTGRDLLCAGASDDDAFEQRIAGQPVGAMQAGAGHFAHCIQAGNVGAPGQVGDDAAAGKVHGRHDGDRLLRNVDAQLEAARVDGREVLHQEFRRLVADVEIDVIEAPFLHLEVDRARHDVAWRQFATLVMRWHEALAGLRARFGWQLEQAAFAADRFGDQERFRIRVVQAGGVELDEFHVRHPAAGAPGHRDAVAGGGVRIRRVQVDLAGAARGQHRVFRLEGEHVATVYILHVQAVAARLAAMRSLGPQLVGRDDVNGDMVFEQRDIRVRAHLLFQRDLHGVPGSIGRMDDPALAMAAFTGQVKAHFGGCVAGEWHALIDQPFDRFTPVFDDIAGGGFVAQACAGNERVGHVLVVAVARIEHGGNTTLGPAAGAIEESTLRNDGNLAGLGQVQGYRQAGQAAADDRDVEFHGMVEMFTEAIL